MNNLRPWVSCVAVGLLLLLLVADAGSARAGTLAKPAEIKISVSPDPLAAGGQAKISVQLKPAEGVKINRYPKIKLKVPAHDGLVEAGEAAVGNSTPPPPDELDKNYFEVVEPLELLLKLDKAAPSGKHEIQGKLSYAYCVIASGYCAPVRVPVNIPVQIH